MIIPAAYASRRNLAKSYTRGFRAGQLADLGGVPLAPYFKGAMIRAFEVGFEQGQRTKEGGFQLDPVEAKPLDVTPRERELFAFIERMQKDISALLQGFTR